MRLFAICVLAAACSRTPRAAVCVPGDGCAPAEPCRAGALVCDPVLACVATDAGVSEGAPCGTGRVCSSGECVLCADGASCVPAQSPCHQGVLSCKTGQPVCNDTGASSPEGASCGGDRVCLGGACGPGDGADGALVYSGTAPLEPARSPARGLAGSTRLALSAAKGFAPGQLLFVHQTQGVNAGHWEEATIASLDLAASPAVATLAAPLQHDYDVGAQALVERRFTSFTVPAGVTLSAAAWDGATGGIIAFKARDTVVVSGRISLSGKGFRGGAAAASTADYVTNAQGESSSGSGPARDPANSSARADGGGSGCGAGSGGGGGNGTAGRPGVFQPSAPGASCTGTCANPLGQGGASAGLSDLTLALPGGGGGASGSQSGAGRNGAAGGAGGGLLFVHAGDLEVPGRIDADGQAGQGGAGGVTQPVGGGGGGAGGGLRLVAGLIRIAGSVSALGGAGGAPQAGTGLACAPAGTGGAGGDGRVFLSSPDLQGATTPPAATGTSP